MTDIDPAERHGKVTASHYGDISPTQPCVATIEGDAGTITFTGAWGSEAVEVTTRSGTLRVATLTWQEVKALERAMNLLAHVITRSGNF